MPGPASTPPPYLLKYKTRLAWWEDANKTKFLIL